MKKELITAIKNALKVRVDRANYGMMSNMKISMRDLRLLDENNIDIYFGYHNNKFNGQCDVIVQNDEIIGVIKRKYASKKVNGMYKELQPTIQWL